MTKKSLCTLFLIIGTFMMSSVFADQGREGMHGKKWMEELNLSEQQKAQLQEIRQAHRDKYKGQRQAMKDARKKLQGALQSEASDVELRSQFKALQTLRQAHATARFEKVLAIRKILTPEQRKKFKAYHHGRWRKHRDKEKPHN